VVVRRRTSCRLARCHRALPKLPQMSAQGVGSSARGGGAGSAAAGGGAPPEPLLVIPRDDVQLRIDSRVREGDYRHAFGLQKGRGQLENGGYVEPVAAPGRAAITTRVRDLWVALGHAPCTVDQPVFVYSCGIKKENCLGTVVKELSASVNIARTELFTKVTTAPVVAAHLALVDVPFRAYSLLRDTRAAREKYVATASRYQQLPAAIRSWFPAHHALAYNVRRIQRLICQLPIGLSVCALRFADWLRDHKNHDQPRHIWAISCLFSDYLAIYTFSLYEIL
jgi:hypothetical protein